MVAPPVTTPREAAQLGAAVQMDLNAYVQRQRERRGLTADERRALRRYLAEKKEALRVSALGALVLLSGHVRTLGTLCESGRRSLGRSDDDSAAIEAVPAHHSCAVRVLECLASAQEAAAVYAAVWRATNDLLQREAGDVGWILGDDLEAAE